MTLDQLPIGETSRILEVNGQGALRRHLLDMGLTPHTQVMVRKVAPMGDPIELHLRGYELTLRLEDARNIVIEGEAPAAGPAFHIQSSGIARESIWRRHRRERTHDIRTRR